MSTYKHTAHLVKLWCCCRLCTTFGYSPTCSLGLQHGKQKINHVCRLYIEGCVMHDKNTKRCGHLRRTNDPTPSLVSVATTPSCLCCKRSCWKITQRSRAPQLSAEALRRPPALSEQTSLGMVVAMACTLLLPNPL